MISRRGFIGGIIAAGVAPAIIHTPGLIMPIKPGLVPRGLAPIAPVQSPPLEQIRAALDDMYRCGGRPSRMFASDAFMEGMRFMGIPIVFDLGVPAGQIIIEGTSR